MGNKVYKSKTELVLEQVKLATKEARSFSPPRRRMGENKKPILGLCQVKCRVDYDDDDSEAKRISLENTAHFKYFPYSPSFFPLSASLRGPQMSEILLSSERGRARCPAQACKFPIEFFAHWFYSQIIGAQSEWW